jgi:peroxiredoxin
MFRGEAFVRQPEEQGDHERRQLVAAGLSAVGVLLLTIVHHLYGASLYQTPWRTHMAHLGAIGIVAILASMLVAVKWGDIGAGRGAFWCFTFVTAVFPVAWIGLFEGGYNHVVKNALYFGGLSEDWMLAMFPPPTYELPNDLLFEVTGVLQFFVALVTMRVLHRLVRTRMGKRLTASGQAVAVALAAALAAVPSGGAVAGPDLYAASAVQPVRNQVPAPEFALRTLEGRPLESSSLLGKVVVVNFWATWCVPCKEEMPSLQKLKQRFNPDEFELLAITTDQQREAIKGFMQALGLTFPVLMDDTRDISAAFGVRGLPTTVLIGRDGRIVARAVGPRKWDSPETAALIGSLMERKP